MIRPGEPHDYAPEILFYLPQIDDPSLPKVGHVFAIGEARIKIDALWLDVMPLSRIVERGEGWYAIQLTPAQRALARDIAYEVNAAGAQPDRGVEVIGDLSGDIAEGGAGILPFYLPDEDDPINGPPVTGHVFTLGEVKLSLPDGAFANVALDHIIEYGAGLYGVLLDASQTAKRGKAIVVATVGGAQRFSGHRTILGSGDGGESLPIPPPVPALPEPTQDGRVSGDLALTWSNEIGDADISLLADASDLTSDQGLKTAVLLSLFLDRRAEDDDKPPSGDERDRRGWWADQFADVEGDRIGSRLWLLDRGKRTNETKLRAAEYVREALAWMLEDRVVASIDVDIEMTKEALLIAIGMQRPGRDPVSFRFAQKWDHMQESN